MNTRTAIAAEPARSAQPLGEYIERFRRRRSLAVTSEHLRRTLRTVRDFAWQAHVRAPEQITADAVADYLAGLRERGLADKTIRNRRAALSAFCNELVEQAFLASNPVTSVRAPPARAPLAVWLTAQEAAETIALADGFGCGREVRLALATGLRMNELRMLRWADVDEANGRLLVRHGKGGRHRVVPLTRGAIGALAAQRRRLPETRGHRLAYVFPARHTWGGARPGWKYVDKPRSRSVWTRMLRPLQEAIPAFRRRPPKSVGNGWHLFRHTFASRLVQAGVSPLKVATWMGHRSVRMVTEVYGHLAPEYDRGIEAADTGENS